MEDGWAAVLRHNGAPVAAATLNVFGEDHARLQVMRLCLWHRCTRSMRAFLCLWKECL